MEKKDSGNFIIFIYIFLNLFNKSNFQFLHPKIYQKEQRKKEAVESSPMQGGRGSSLFIQSQSFLCTRMAL